MSTRDYSGNMGITNLHLLDAIRVAGVSGVIARKSTPNDMIFVRSFDSASSIGVFVSVTDSDIGNWDPTLEDKTAQDWFIVSKRIAR
jgi:hypothetical protein